MWNSYNIANFVVNILVAFGTIGAVWVALWQTRKQYKVEVDTHFMLGRASGQIYSDISNDTDYLIVSVTNKGIRPVTINHIPSFYLSEKKNGGTASFVRPIVPKNTVTIQPFTSQTFILSQQEQFSKMMNDSENKLNKEKMKLFLSCSTGEAIEIKTFKEFRKKIFQ